MFELLLSHTVFLELDGTTVVDVEDHIEQGQLHDIGGDLHGNGPFVGQAVEFAGSFLGQSLNDMVKSLRRIEKLQILLLDGIDQELTVCGDLLGRGRRERSASWGAGGTWRSSWRRPIARTGRRATGIGRTGGIRLALI